MLRSLVLILFIVNAAFFAWSQGWLNDVVGVKPNAQREPQRLAQQVNPDKISVVPPPAVSGVAADTQTAQPAAQASAPDAEASAEVAPEGAGASEAAAASGSAAEAGPAGSGPAPASAPAVPPVAPGPPVVATAGASKPAGKGICIEAGPFTAAEYTSAEAMVRPLLSAGSWARQNVAIQGMWLVYMGPYADAEQLQRKQEELKRIKGLDFEVVRSPAALAQGISLGRFSKQDNAENQLEILRNRGIRTARIVTLRAPMELQLIRVPKADVEAQVKLAGLKLPQGKGFTACRR